MQYGLRARDRRPAGFEAPEIGTFIHYLLENVAREVKTRGGWAAVQQPELRQLVREYTDRYAREEIDGYQEKSARFRYLFSRLRTAAYAIVEDMAGELAQSDFSPVAFELGFGGKDGQLPAVTITEGDQRLSVSGKVDRVDGWLHDGRLYLRVVDYKTGKKSFDLSDLRYGLGIQMLLYLFTLEQEGRSLFRLSHRPAGVLYHPAREVILKADRGIQPEKLQLALQSALRRSGMVLSDPQVLRAMGAQRLESPHYLPIKVKKDGSIADASPRRSSWASWAAMWTACCTRSPGRSAPAASTPTRWPTAPRTGPASTATLPPPAGSRRAGAVTGCGTSEA